MSERPLNAAEIQKDHAITHFFALLAGIEELDVRTRLLVSGLAFFLRMDAVVLGFHDGATHACSVHLCHGGVTSAFQTTAAEESSIEASASRAMEEVGFPGAKMLGLIYQGRILGYLAVARRQPAQLTSEEEFLLTSFQTLTALLLANHYAVIEIRQQSAHLQVALEAVNRRTRTLNGINTIFKEALKCETLEELGQACLRVAEEITGSKFGFIGEMGADGMLHDIAISDPGWKLCSIHDQAGHRRPPGNFKVHGLYGRVLQDGKSLLTNTPAEHPASIGTPAGHPPLTAFLGVPLVDGNRTVGMIAVGNREGGYQQEEMDALEALAPAIVEALHRNRTEQALIRSEKLVSVGRLAATIAHEINNPLAAATNAVFLVSQDKSLSPESRVLTDLAERELRRAAQIARRTLGFYREPNDRTALPLKQLIEELTAVYEPPLRNKGIRIQLRYRDESACVRGNAGEVRQLLSNLLANSIDAVREAGTVHIRVAKACSANGASYFRITIADTGAGIERQNLARVFEPFFTTKKDVGTGLGLWISEQIVKKHSGTIRVRSRVGQGTVFCVRLPAAIGRTAASAAAAGVTD